MIRKSIITLIGLVVLVSMILTACQPETIVETVIVTEVVEKEGETIIETKVVEEEVEKPVEVIKTQEVEVEVPVEKQVLIYNSYMSDPDPRAADAEVVAMFSEARRFWLF